MEAAGAAFASGEEFGFELVDLFAEAALCAAFRELVAVHGEEKAAAFAERLSERVRHGEFSSAASASAMASRSGACSASALASASRPALSFSVSGVISAPSRSAAISARFSKRDV